MVRIFGIPKFNKLYSLNRGLSAGDIYSMSFNNSSTLFGITSVSGNLQIYQLVKSIIIEPQRGKSVSPRIRGYGYF